MQRKLNGELDALTRAGGPTFQPIFAAPTPSPRATAVAPLGRAGLLELQRTAGNRAVSGLLARARATPAPLTGTPVVQRKNLLQALTPLGTAAGIRGETHREFIENVFPDPADKAKTIKLKQLGPEIETKRTLVVSGSALPKEVKVFEQTAVGLSANRLTALQQAATYNATVGKNIDAYAASVGLLRNANVKWTKNPEKFNKPTVPTLDPFFYEICVPFSGPPRTPTETDGTREMLGLIYQHAAEFTGYVEAIYDSTNLDTGDLPTMYDKGENTETAKANKNFRNPKYSNVHATDLTSRSPKLLDLTSGKDERNLDAYTKIAGEGARWECVNKHAGNLQDNTVFYIDHPSDPRVRGVTFKTLWLSWAGVFNKAYGVADGVVADAIRNDRFAKAFPSRGEQWYLRSALQENRDYDLTSGQPFRIPFQCIRGLGASLLPATSYFFIRDRRGDVRNTWWGVRVDTLWSKWPTVFAATADVPDSTVGTKLWNYNLDKSNTHLLHGKDRCKGRDYDLDNGQPY